MNLKRGSLDVYTGKYKNGVVIKIIFYSKRIKGFPNSDRIHLWVKQVSGKRRGWVMNILEAQDIIIGLSKATSLALEGGVPPFEIRKLFTPKI